MVNMNNILKFFNIHSRTEKSRSYYPSRCYLCANWKTMMCPNSSKCMDIASKPYFKERQFAKNTTPFMAENLNYIKGDIYHGKVFKF